MKTQRAMPHALLAAAGVALFLTAGCASPPTVATRMTPDPMGTVTTYHRKSSGSLGNYDGQVAWTHAASTWQGKPVIAFGSSQTVSLHDPANFGLLAVLTPDGKPQAAYEPAFDYEWPLEVGKTWSKDYKLTQYPSGRVVPFKVEGKVLAWEDVTVPAGTFKAFKLQWSNNFGEIETRWLNPAEGIATIKRHVERPASHPQGAGVLDAVLLSRVRPAK